jgi:hypothetical protein
LGIRSAGAGRAVVSLQAVVAEEGMDRAVDRDVHRRCRQVGFVLVDVGGGGQTVVGARHRHDGETGALRHVPHRVRGVEQQTDEFVPVALGVAGSDGTAE